MALQYTQENYTVGEDVDFDELNDLRLKSLLQQGAPQFPNTQIDTRNLNGGPDSPTKLEKGSKRIRDIDLKETPIERVNRLKRELRELKENLETIRQREKDIKLINPETQISLLQEIEGLQNQLTSIYQNEDFTTKGQNQEAGDAREILGLKASIKQQQAEALLVNLKQIQNSKLTKNEQVIYKINSKSQDQTLKNENKIGDLENRISKLETSARESNVLNLIHEVQKIRELVEAAISANQDAVNKKLNQVFQEMDTLNHKRQNLELSDPRYVKVAKMHENFLKLQRIGEILPELINRLECLKFIHEDSVNVNDNIQKIKDNKEEIKSHLQNGNSLLNQVCATLDSNLPKIKSEIQLLTEKVEKLTTK